MLTLTPEDARARLVSWLDLAAPSLRGLDGVRALLDRLNHIQLDPLDPLGTNADLVAMARVADVDRGDVYRALGGGPSFEHFAKMRCLLPARAFPWYRDHLAKTDTNWWGTGRKQRLPDGILDLVLDEVRDRGPLTSRELTDRGAVRAFDYSGWKGTGKATTMALEELWAQCAVVVCGRSSTGNRRYAVPEQVFADQVAAKSTAWGPWAVMQRARAAGLLQTATGPQWVALREARKDGTVDALVDEGQLVRLRIAGSSRSYLAPAELLEAPVQEPDDAIRLLGPLDPLIWDRKLVLHIFGFEYLWEVYKPKAKRRWGWYVVPLLRAGRLIGRLDGAIDGDALRVRKVWWESPADRDVPALRATLLDHARRCGAKRVVGLR